MSSTSAVRSVGVLLLGAGNVGQALIQQIRSSRPLHASLFQVRFDVYTLVDSTGYATSASSSTPLSDSDIDRLLEWKSQSKKPLSAYPSFGASGSSLDAVRKLIASAPKPLIVVDASGAADTAPALQYALDNGAGAALANKKPLADTPQQTFESLTAPSNRFRLKYESTVGAGTPLVAATLRVHHSGDSIRQLLGTFSGTLGFLMTSLESGKKYSEAVKEAMQLGYTEPDPRDDLGGVDVARKALILARSVGWKLEMSDLKIEPLFPASVANLSIPDFVAALPQLDEEYAQKNQTAKSNNCVLRYVAQVKDGKVSVGLQSVAKDSPLGRLQGTENMLEIHTSVYGSKPLVIQGAGAGGTVTAVGILADMVDLAGVLRQ